MVDGPFGIKVLLTPTSPELADLVTVDHIRRIFGELRKMFDYIIVDSSAHLGEINLEVLDHADKVVVVTSLSIPSINEHQAGLEDLRFPLDLSRPGGPAPEQVGRPFRIQQGERRGQPSAFRSRARFPTTPSSSSTP